MMAEETEAAGLPPGADLGFLILERALEFIDDDEEEKVEALAATVRQLGTSQVVLGRILGSENIVHAGEGFERVAGMIADKDRSRLKQTLAAVRDAFEAMRKNALG